jgi:hypothetical protein
VAVMYTVSKGGKTTASVGGGRRTAVTARDA